MTRSTDRLLALAMLIVGIACFAKLYPALGGRPSATARLEIFGAAGVLSVLAGLLFLPGCCPAPPGTIRPPRCLAAMPRSRRPAIRDCAAQH
ncbi:exported hypothetical protein [Mesorhizobium sp. SOD10]|nr:exported hypothetical protein [Mesorhizobium sp. SOD10]